MEVGARNHLSVAAIPIEHGSTSPRTPTIALAAHWNTFPDRFTWIIENGFALEYSPNPEASSLPTHIGPMLQAGIPVRHHAFFPGYEIGSADRKDAEKAVRIHLAALDALAGWGEQVITIHVGLKRELLLDHGLAVENLARLVQHAQKQGITVCLENLRSGPTSNPETVIEWASRSGSMITLDVGHAVSSQRVIDGELTPIDYISMFGDRLFEAHMYERETDRHHPPQDMTILGPIIDQLVSSRCAWWTIELNDFHEALETRRLLLDYLRINFR